MFPSFSYVFFFFLKKTTAEIKNTTVEYVNDIRNSSRKNVTIENRSQVTGRRVVRTRYNQYMLRSETKKLLYPNLKFLKYFILATTRSLW